MLSLYSLWSLDPGGEKFSVKGSDWTRVSRMFPPPPLLLYIRRRIHRQDLHRGRHAHPPEEKNNILYIGTSGIPPKGKMEQPITAVEISFGRDQQIQLIQEQFTKLEINLNTEEMPVFLWYKRGSENLITRIQFSFREEMIHGLQNSGFTHIPQRINEGAPDYPIRLWYMRGTTEFDFPIVDLRVTTSLQEEPALFSNNWERLGCDLNRSNNSGHPVYVWVKRRGRTYICDITATIGFAEDVGLFNQGFFRVDEDTNRGLPLTNPPTNPPSSFIWYRHSSVQGITRVRVSVGDEVIDGFIRVDKNLNSESTPVYLCYSNGPHRPVQYLTVLVSEAARDAYGAPNITVVIVNLNFEIPRSIPLFIAYSSWANPGAPQDPE
ncbi:hypothetical protein SRHO_G00256370 [Serrasalmus rhombeus]